MAAPNVAPPNNTIGADPWGTSTVALNALQAVMREMPHNRAPVAQNCPVGGVLVLTAASLKLVRVTNVDDPQNPYDEVLRIDPASLADGLSVMLEAANPTQPITIRHLSSSGTLSGEIDLAGDVDLVLAAKGQRVWLQRRDTRVVEVARFGFASGGDGADLVQFNNDIDANGKAVTNLLRKVRDSASSTTTITTADRDTAVHVGGATVALPTSPTGWRREDSVILVQGGAEMLITPASNIVNPLNHDRGYGAGATVVCTVHALTTPLLWRIGGLTKGGTTTPPPTEIFRSAQWSLLSSTVSTPASSAAYLTAASVSHDVLTASERWAYIGVGAFALNPNNNANRGNLRMRASAESDGPMTMAARFSQGRESAGLLSYRTHVATGSRTHLIEIQADLSTDTGSTATVVQPGVVALKLETDEHAFATTTAATANSTTFIDAGSYTGTFLADDYVVVAHCEFANSAGNTGATMRLVVDGANSNERQRHKPLTTAMHGAWSALKPITLTAGSHTIKVQIALPTGASGNVTSDRVTIVILKKSRFETWHTDDDPAPVTNSTTTPATVSAITQTWMNGWDYLVLANATLKASLSSTTVQARMQVTVGGVAFGPEIRSGPHVDDTFHPCSGLVATVFRGDGTSKAVSLTFYCQGTATATLADSALLVVPLVRP